MSTEAQPAIFDDLLGEVEIPENGILSRTVLKREGLRAVLFGFDGGQELSEHTAASPAVLHFLSGRAAVTLGDGALTAGPGTWIWLPANEPHSVHALEQVVMLLLLLPQVA